MLSCIHPVFHCQNRHFDATIRSGNTMSESANVQSVQAIRDFEGALVKFHDVASRAASSMDQQARRMLQWLELDRPNFWKRQVEVGHQHLAEARTRLTQCKMRRTGDFRPSCYDEKKALDKAKHDLEYARQQIQIVKQWTIKAKHEIDEFSGRQAQLTRMLEGDVPRMCALLQRIVQKLEQYTTITAEDAVPLVTSTVEEATSADGSESGDTE